MLYHTPSVVLYVFLFLINLELFSGKKKKSCFVPLFFLYVNVQLYWILSCGGEKTKQKKQHYISFT